MKRLSLAACLFACLFVGISGCGSSDSESSDSEAKAHQVSVSAELETKLAEADALDGETDKTIHLCYSCALGMDGDAEIAAEVNGYSAHFCSEYCLETFELDAEKIVSQTDTSSDETEDDSQQDSEAEPTEEG